MDWMEIVEAFLKEIGREGGKEVWRAAWRYVGGKWARLGDRDEVDGQADSEPEGRHPPSQATIGLRPPQGSWEGDVWVNTSVPSARVLVLMERYVLVQGTNEVTRHWELMVTTEDHIEIQGNRPEKGSWVPKMMLNVNLPSQEHARIHYLGELLAEQAGATSYGLPSVAEKYGR